jgi:superfamily II DNA/RNA helicase
MLTVFSSFTFRFLLYQVIAFFTTARQTQYMAELMNAAGVPTLEIHSRKSQAQRQKASDAFRAVSAGRWMDMYIYIINCMNISYTSAEADHT